MMIRQKIIYQFNWGRYIPVLSFLIDFYWEGQVATCPGRIVPEYWKVRVAICPAFYNGG